MTKTENYQLNQWDAADPIRREDFNADNAAIDAALGTMAAAIGSGGGRIARISAGSYTGTGTCGSSNPNTLTFDFAPSLVIVLGNNRFCIFVRGSSQGLAHYASSATYRDVQAVTWGENSISWYISTSYSENGSYVSVSDACQLNSSKNTYYYVAIG